MPALWAVALILLLSGTAKLRSGEDVQATFTRLRVPRPLAAPAPARHVFAATRAGRERRPTVAAVLDALIA